MYISVVGSGYVGTTLAACFADLGHEVLAIDVDDETVQQINNGETSIHEPGLEPLISAYAGGRLKATTQHEAAVKTGLTFLAVGTPANDNGSIDASILLEAAADVGKAIADKDEYHLVVVKSTVLPDVIEDDLVPLIESTSGKTDGEEIGVAVNPEFLREGSAVDDFMDPDKIVVGTDGDDRALDRLARVYEPLVAEWDVPTIETGRREASMIKYANNSFLAAKISLINDIGNICKEYGVDIYEVAEAIGMDARIGDKFLRSGVGFGGSCFPKDTNALIHAAQETGYDPAMIEATLEVNETQPQRMLVLLDDHLDVDDKPVVVLGLAFKPGTDDIRGSRAKPIIESLLERGADVVAFDPNPQAVEAMSQQYPNIEYADSASEALQGAHAAVVVTDWSEFADLDTEFDTMADPIVVDGRRIITRRDGITYEGLTW